MKDQCSSGSHHLHSPKHLFWLSSLASLLWLALRSGTNPRRLAYPCQRAALVNSLAFLASLSSLLGSTHLFRRLKRRATPLSIILFSLSLFFVTLLTGSAIPPVPAQSASLQLPQWTSANAISNIFAVSNVPVPVCSLNGGALPATFPCNQPAYALKDDGVDALIQSMEDNGTYFYQTESHLTGIVSANDVVIIKINNQWGGNFGTGSGWGRMSTNTDVIKGIIWRILQHPEGFRGEIVIADNTQTRINNWDAYPANAQDRYQSILDVVKAFQSLGYPVSLYSWTDIYTRLISGGRVDSDGYPLGEYARSNMQDGYILLDDPTHPVKNEFSYPKFRTAGGNYVSMRYGIWDPATRSYHPERLTLINVPVLKKHMLASATIAWKNLVGLVTVSDYTARFGSYDAMHNQFFGYYGNSNYGLIGRQLALVRAPDLNIVDATWVAYENHYSGPASRQDVLLASIDPFAVDWYASEYVLRPLVSQNPQNSSAARRGTFRQATRINQNAAQLVWQHGTYPYIDLLDNYDGDSPSQDEMSQMNIFVADLAQKITSAPAQLAPSGPTRLLGNMHATFSWAAIGGASEYQLSLEGPAGNLLQEWYSASQAGCPSGKGVCEVSVAISLDTTTYHWKVRGRNANGEGPWSNLTSFTPQKVVPLVPGPHDDGQTDIVYNPGWNLYRASTASGGVFHYSDGPGRTAGIDFDGSGVKLIYTAHPLYGDMALQIDDGPPIALKQSAASLLWQQEWVSQALPPGEHRLTLKHASGQYVSLDGFYITSPLGVGKYDDTNPNILFAKSSGRWLSYTTNLAYQGTFKYSDVVGSRLSLAFSGAQVRLVYLAHPSYGSMSIQIDDNPPVILNQSAPTMRWQQTWLSQVVPPGNHTLTLTHSGGAYVGLDAIEILDSPTCRLLTLQASGPGGPPSAIPTNSAGCPTNYYYAGELINLSSFPDPGNHLEHWEGTKASSSSQLTMPDSNHIVIAYYAQNAQPDSYDDSSPQVIYQGNWLTYSNAAATNAAMHYSTTVGNVAHFYFTGARLNLIYTAHPLYGNLTIQIDDNPPLNLNQYAPSLQWQKIWQSDWLANGDHRLTLTHANGAYVTLDSIQVSALPQCHVLTRTASTGGDIPAASPSSSIGCPEGEYYPGEVILLTAQPTSGYHLERWEGCDSPTSSRLTMPDNDHTVVAYYAQNTLAGTYDDSDPSIVYTSVGKGWHILNINGASNGAFHYSDGPGSSAKIYFTGTRIGMIFARHPLYGTLTIQIDNNPPLTLNQYAYSLQQGESWISDLLPNGDHVLIITHTSGSYITLDGILVE